MHSTTMIQRNLVGADRPRSAPRHKIFEPTRLHLAEGEVRAHLINVSLSGALVHAQSAPRRGESVRIEIAGTTVAGQVRWADGPRFGLAFAQPLNPLLLGRLLGEECPDG
jgi:hypothetical protein